jgi:biopolymer transport protein ExbD
MGMSGSGLDPSGHGTLSEINVTPLVDVMLVLLTIFMVASSVETIQVAAEREKLLKERQDEAERVALMTKLDKMKQKEEERIELKNREERRMQFMELQEEKLKTIEELLDDRSQNVPIELPKATSEAVNLAEQKKLVVTLTREFLFYIGDTKVVDCNDPQLAVSGGAPGPAAGKGEISDQAFAACLALIEKKMVANEKLKGEKECYLRADKRLDYGRVLALMATIRKAGVTKFGLVSEEDEAASAVK